ncbi:MAG: hypothetical protein R2765_08540 [Ferruginibacter sp.]
MHLRQQMQVKIILNSLLVLSNSTSGGTLAPGESYTLRFKVLTPPDYNQLSQ